MRAASSFVAAGERHQKPRTHQSKLNRSITDETGLDRPNAHQLPTNSSESANAIMALARHAARQQKATNHKFKYI